MSQSSPKSLRKSPKRDHLVRTAFKLFNERGYHAVGIDTILAEAGVAKMTLYNHFKSKEELIIAALGHRAETILEHREAAIARAGPEPQEQIAAIFDGYEAWFRTPDFRGCAFIRAVGEFPDPESPINLLVQKEKQRLVQLLSELCAEASARHPEILAQQIYLLAEGAIVRAHTFQAPDSAEIAKQAALTLLRGDGRHDPEELPTHLL